MLRCLFPLAAVISGSLFFGLSSYSLALAEVIPDATLPNDSRVSRQQNVRIIEGGTREGGNLFHSFQEFSIPTGSTAHFNNARSIENIFTRITGGSRSNIDGTIRANGTANLFLLNPNGILFGRDASLNIGGSFFATTAESINFEDGAQFSAVNPQASSLLTVSVPNGLQFGQNPGSIRNEAIAQQIDPITGNPTVSESDEPIFGLQVPRGETIALVGGNVNLPGGILTVGGGRIEIGSVADPGLVELNLLEQRYALNYTNIQEFGDIWLSGAYLDARGEAGSSIQIQGRNVIFSNDSEANASTFGNGGSVVIEASESFRLSSSNLFAQVFGSGEGGDITVRTGRMFIQGGANLNSSTLANGQAGDISIEAQNSIEIAGTSPNNEPSIIASQVGNADEYQGATGSGGDITVRTQRLVIRDGGLIDAATFAQGNAGNIDIYASDSIELSGEPRNGTEVYTTGITTQVAVSNPTDSGNAGTLNIRTGQLNILDGAQIISAARRDGEGGATTINSDVIRISGIASDATRDPDTGFTVSRSGIFVSAEPARLGEVATIGDAGSLEINAEQLNVEDRGEISANNGGSGQGGDIFINVNQLLVQEGGEIRASSLNEGEGGSLVVNAAESIDITGSGTIGSINFPSAIAALATSSGDAGDVRITTASLNVENGAEISVSGEGQGAAGNLDIQADVIHLNQGNLFAETQQGSGANIQLQGNLLLMQNGSLVSARASELADGGDVTITMPNGFVVAGLDEDNDIIASAVAGRGGNIFIDAQSIIGLEERRDTLANSTNDIDASSEFGAPGSVTINQPDVDPSRGLSELPSDLVDASNLVAQPCSTGGAVARERGEFTITGRSGLPPDPTAPRGTGLPPTEWATLEEESQIEQSALELETLAQNPARVEEPWNYEDEIVEAQGWMVGEQGEIILVAEAPASPQVSTTNLNCNTALGN